MLGVVLLLLLVLPTPSNIHRVPMPNMIPNQCANGSEIFRRFVCRQPTTRRPAAVSSSYTTILVAAHKDPRCLLNVSADTLVTRLGHPRSVWNQADRAVNSLQYAGATNQWQNTCRYFFAAQLRRPMRDPQFFRSSSPRRLARRLRCQCRLRSATAVIVIVTVSTDAL
jgi:hypothetical protein